MRRTPGTHMRAARHRYGFAAGHVTEKGSRGRHNEWRLTLRGDGSLGNPKRAQKKWGQNEAKESHGYNEYRAGSPRCQGPGRPSFLMGLKNAGTRKEENDAAALGRGVGSYGSTVKFHHAFTDPKAKASPRFAVGRRSRLSELFENAR